MQRGKHRLRFGRGEGGFVGAAEFHHVSHHVDVRLVQIRPDPIMIGPDIESDLPSIGFGLPAPLLGVEVWEIEPVRDDSLERCVCLSDLSAVGPSFAALSPGRGQAHVTVRPSQQQSDVAGWSPGVRALRDPPGQIELWDARQLDYARKVVCRRAADGSVMQQDRLPRIVEGVYRGERWVRYVS